MVKFPPIHSSFSELYRIGSFWLRNFTSTSRQASNTENTDHLPRTRIVAFNEPPWKTAGITKNDFISWKKQKEANEKKIKIKTITQEALKKTPSRFQLVNPQSFRFRRKKDSSLYSSSSQMTLDMSVKKNLKIKTPSSIGNVKKEFTSTSFESLGLSSDICSYLFSSLNIQEPSSIQKLSIPFLLKNSNALIAAETGSGKTLSYLLPICQRLKAEEELEGGEDIMKGSEKNLLTPRCIILTPTRELVNQTIDVVKGLCRHIRLRGCAIAPGLSKTVESSVLESSADILVTAPPLFVKYIAHGGLKLDRLKYLVLDEVDTLFDTEFAEDIKNIVDHLKKKASISSTILVSATFTKPMKQMIDVLFSKIAYIFTDDLHKTSDLIKQRFFRVDKPGNAKGELCLQLLKSEPTSRFLVFCNSRDIADNLFHLVQKEFPHASLLHGGVLPEERDRIIKAFNSAETNLIICTDLVSRGIDAYNVNHVVLFDFPKNVVDYLHRVGRTGRAGKGGKITSFITAKDENLFKFIQMAIYSHKPLDRFRAH